MTESSSVTPKEHESSAEFLYKGVKVTGVDFLEKSGTLNKTDVVALLDKFPEGYYRFVPLGEIAFTPYQMFSVNRDGETKFVKDSEREPTDIVKRRLRGLSQWNLTFKNGVYRPTDGLMTAKIFSPVDWEGKPEGQTDKDIAMYTLSHEMGHSYWALMTTALGNFAYLYQHGLPLPREVSPVNWSAFTKAWAGLPENQLKRYQDYLPIFTEEMKRKEEGLDVPSFEEVRPNEDFAVSCEHMYYWQDLQDQDPTRYEFMKYMEQFLNLGSPVFSGTA